MKIYVDPTNKWVICLEGKDKNDKPVKVWHAVPPTNGDRIDIFTDKELVSLYNVNYDGIVIVIRDGAISNLYWTHNNKVHEQKRFIR